MKAMLLSLAVASMLFYGFLYADQAELDLSTPQTNAAARLDEDPGQPGQRWRNEWLGAVSTDWHNDANCSYGHVPTSTEIVYVSGGSATYQPVCSGPANCDDILVDLSGSLTLTGGYVWATGTPIQALPSPALPEAGSTTCW